MYKFVEKILGELNIFLFESCSMGCGFFGDHGSYILYISIYFFLSNESSPHDQSYC